jgi:hypothetical protein
MDLGRDEFQENIIEDIIRGNDDDVTSLFLNNFGEGDEQNRRDGFDEGEGAGEDGGTGEGEGAGEDGGTNEGEGTGSDEGEADGSDRTFNIAKFGEVDVY